MTWLGVFANVDHAILQSVPLAADGAAVENFRDDARGWLIENAISTSQGIALAVLVVAAFAYRKLQQIAEQETLSQDEGKGNKQSKSA